MRAGELSTELLLLNFDEKELFNFDIDDAGVFHAEVQQLEPPRPPSTPGSKSPSPPVSPGQLTPGRKYKQKNPIARHKRESHINAELRRRFKIQRGFDDLKKLVPTIDDAPGSRESKAAMLFKAADYSRQLQEQRAQLKEEANAIRKEIEMLTGQISICTSELPESGVEVQSTVANKRPMTDSSQLGPMFENHIRMRTYENWKYWIFGMIMRPMFDSFNNAVSTDTWENFGQSVLAWIQQHCSLGSLRSVVLNSLRHLSTSTSVMTNPSQLPQEAVQAALEACNLNGS